MDLMLTKKVSFLNSTRTKIQDFTMTLQGIKKVTMTPVVTMLDSMRLARENREPTLVKRVAIKRDTRLLDSTKSTTRTNSKRNTVSMMNQTRADTRIITAREKVRLVPKMVVSKREVM